MSHSSKYPYPSFQTLSEKALLEAQTSFDFARLEQFHGVNVSDEYRDLESDSPNRQIWIKKQTELTHRVMAAARENIPEVTRVDQTVKNVLDMADFRQFAVCGPRLFFRARPAGKEHCAVYVSDTPESEPRILLDPNVWAADGSIALGDITISNDGQYLIYSLGFRGQSTNLCKFMHVASGLTMAEDAYYGAKFSTQCDGTFYISGTNLWYHKIGTEYKEDKFHGTPTGAEVSKVNYWRVQSATHERFVILEGLTATTTGGGLICAIDKNTRKCVWLFGGKPVNATLRRIDGDKFVFVQTDVQYPMGRLVSIEISSTEAEKEPITTELIPASRDCSIVDVIYHCDRYVVHYQKEAVSRIAVFDNTGKLTARGKLPVYSVVDELTFDRNPGCALLSIGTLSRAKQYVSLDLSTGKTRMIAPQHLSGLPFKSRPFRHSQYVVKRVRFRSKDGVIVTMYLSHRRNLPLDGSNRVLLSGYGGFSHRYGPQAQAQFRVGLELGCVIATVCIRGGAENGEQWHLAGMKENKQKVFDDFIAAAESLISAGYTRPGKLAIQGASNGGLLMAACLTQRPDLFGCVISINGLSDMLRFDKMTKNGAAWRPEYGDTSIKKDFFTLLSYSPLHRIIAGANYPATMMMVGDCDDNVSQGHSFKFLASLQKAQGGFAPLLLHYQERTGHGLKDCNRQHATCIKAMWEFILLATAETQVKMADTND